ncbi:MAG: DUF4118 domain-containing protein [Sphingomonadaceae bacterium]|nr:DUF4118 domain-containing protein [Sphingomonadaceae bacterium]
MIVEQQRRRTASGPEGYVWATALVAAATACGLAAHDHLGLANIALIYLLPVLLASGRWGLAPGLFASAAGALAFNFFLVPPRFTLRVAEPGNLVTMAVLFTVAVVVSELASRLRHQARRAESASTRNALVADFAGRLSAADDAEAVAAMLVETLRRAPGVDARYIAVESGRPAGSDFDGLDAAAAQWTIDNSEPTGRGTAIMAAAEHMFAPIAFDGEVHALVALDRADATLPMAEDDGALLAALLERSGQAVARIGLAAGHAAIQRRGQEDRLREALLSSVGHDLRTPLTTILGGLRALPVAAEGRVMLAMLVDQATRLERMIANLLEMTRIEAGALAPRHEPIDLTDAIAAAIEAVEPRRGERTITVDMAADVPLVRTDARLIHHMLINLVDNALKFGGPDGAVTIAAARSGDGGVRLTVSDTGPGIDADRADDLFARFAHISGDDRSGGAGLGLAIVRGFGDALGIATRAANRTPGPGAVFAVDFPPALVLAGKERAALG